MNPLDSPEYGSHALLYLGNVALTAIIAASAALAACLLCRRGSAPFRYGILLCGLIFVMAAPLLVWAADYAGVTGVRIPIQDHATRPVESDDSLRSDRGALFERPKRPPIESTLDVNETVSESQESSSIDVTPIPHAPIEILPAKESTTSTFRGNPYHWWSRGAFVVLDGLWATGSVLGLLILMRGLLRVLRFRLRLREAASHRVQNVAQQAAIAAGLPRAPAVYVTRSAAMPLVMGLFRPVIVLPIGFEEKCNQGQLRDVLLHESAHIARRDQWVGLVQRLASALFWWCPAVHMLCRRMSQLREEICDNYVLAQADSDELRYADLLLSMAESTIERLNLPATAAMFGDSNCLKVRITHLLNKEKNKMTRVNRSTRFLVLLFGLMLGGLATLAHVSVAHQSALAETQHRVVAAVSADEFQPEVAAQPRLELPAAEPVVQEKPAPGKGKVKPKQRTANPYLELVRKRSKLFGQLIKAKIDINRGKELGKLQEAITAADKAYRDEVSKRLLVLKKTEKTAQEALQKLKAEITADNPKLAKAAMDIESFKEKRADADYRRALADFKLNHVTSPIRRALASDENLKKLQKNFYKGRDSRKKYEDARQARLNAIPGAKEILKNLNDAQQELRDIGTATYAAQKTLRDGLDPRKNKAIKELQDKHNTARRAVYQVNNAKDLRKLGNARTAARAALEKKRKELLSSDKLKSLQQQITAIDAQIRELRSKQRSKKSKNP